VAEVEILAHQDGADVQAAYQNLLDELFGGEAREIEVKGRTTAASRPTAANQSCAAHWWRGGAGRIPAENSAWGGIEGQGGGDVASFRGVLDGGADDGLMAGWMPSKLPMARTLPRPGGAY